MFAGTSGADSTTREDRDQRSQHSRRRSAWTQEWRHRAAPMDNTLNAPVRSIALISLFDGAGIARLGLDDVLVHAGGSGTLVASMAAEVDPEIAAATQRALGELA
eukprot:7366406-Prorocentrum_lima.AAC.1